LQEYPPVIRQVLYQRGIRTRVEAERYLAKPADAIHDPLSLANMSSAVDLVEKRIQGNDKIVVFGDYDADGVTATALLVEALTGLGAAVSTYIPDRFSEGYGLNLTALDRIRQSGATMVITVDCGIRGVDEIAHANDLGLDVIITDHHHPGPDLPRANVILNPRLPADDYPFQDLAGVGLAYKLAQALYEGRGDSPPEDLLELVAIGTVADLAPLRGENRVLVARGIGQLQHTERPGLRALISESGLEPIQINAMHIGFGLGPRLNAAGRMDSAELALKLLLAQDMAVARPLAQELDRLNRSRQQETRRVVERARELVSEQNRQGEIIFAADESFHEGVVGLAAGRLMEEFYRPALVARLDGDRLRGSARSIPEFHITKALEACSDLLLQFGGHQAAAGFTLLAEQAEKLVAGLNSQAALLFGEAEPFRRLHLDAVIELDQLNEKLLAWFDQLEPVGQGNPAPLLAVFGAKVDRMRQVGRDQSHLKISLTDGFRPYDGIAFRMGDRMRVLGRAVDVAFHYEWNEFRGVRQPQLQIVDIRPAQIDPVS
ncbi:MAG: single-stranded-DNA-specific exonuclease RecJ, partial [Anaerolineales bacterium]